MLVEYVDPMDNSPHLKFILGNGKVQKLFLWNGTKYFLILMDIGTIEYDRK